MFVATVMSFLARTSACLAEFLSKPIETRVAMESSIGSVADGMEEGMFLWNQTRKLYDIKTELHPKSLYIH